MKFTVPDSITLRTSGATATIRPLGAELRQWRVGAHDLLWTPDARYWNAVSPILFPVVGWIRNSEVRVGGKTYPMKVHGFADVTPFTVSEQRGDFVRLGCADSAATRAHYPFAFELEVAYALTEHSLSAAITVRNTGNTLMPYATGFHPGFRWPLAGGAKEDHVIEFDKAERAEVPVIAPGGLIGAGRRAVPLRGRVLPLTETLFAKDALCFLDAASGSLRFTSPEAELTISAENFAHIALWSRPGAPFLCIENWTGHGDPEGFAGDLFEKPGMKTLAPGESARHSVEYKFIMTSSR